MRRVGWVFGLLLTGFVGVSQAAMPDAASFVGDVVAQRIDPAAFDFAGAGFWELDDDQRMEWNWNMARAIDNPDGIIDPTLLTPRVLDPTGSCDPAAQRRYAAMAWAVAALKSDDANAWKTAQAELLQRRTKLDATLTTSAASVSVPANAPRVAELLRRAARDRNLHAAMDDSTWTEGMSQGAEFAWYLVIRTRMLAIVCDNSDWLKTQVAASGWFDARKFGHAADEAAWQLLARSNRDPDFQVETLSMLRKLPPEATSQQQLARLDDELAFEEQRAQRYGTKRLCMHDGGSKMWPDLEDPAHVNERRARMGLESIDPAPLQKDPACP